MNKILTALGGLAFCLAFGAQAAGLVTGLDAEAERDRIQSERKAIEARYAQEQAACFQKFAVNDCRDVSRASRRTALGDLRRQEVALNDAERKRKAAAQVHRLEQKNSQEAQQQSTQRRERSKTQAVTREATAERRQHEQSAPRPGRTPHDPAAGRKDAATTAALAEEERERYRRKLDDAATHKAQTLQRNAERTKANAKPLPPAQ